MDKKIVYELMNGWIDLDENPEYQKYQVEDEFKNGKECDVLLQQIDEASNRLLEIIGENKTDLEIIQNCYERMTSILCYKMFDYGYSSK